MPDVSFSIAQRTYTLRCAPGQEERLQAAAADLAARVARLDGMAGGGGDRQMLVIAAIELIDALADAEAAKTDAAAAAAEVTALRAWAGDVADRLDTLAAAASPVEPGGVVADELVPGTKEA